MPGFAAVRSSATSQGGLLAIAAALAAFALAYSFADSTEGRLVWSEYVVCQDTTGFVYLIGGENSWFPASAGQVQGGGFLYPDTVPVPTGSGIWYHVADNSTGYPPTQRWQRDPPGGYPVVAAPIRRTLWTVPDRSGPDGLIVQLGQGLHTLCAL